MLISVVKIKGVDHTLKHPIEIDERESWLGGKHMYVFENKELGLLSYHNNIEISRITMQESVNLIIGSYLFEDYSNPDQEKSLKFQTMLKRHIYG